MATVLQKNPISLNWVPVVESNNLTSTSMDIPSTDTSSLVAYDPEVLNVLENVMKLNKNGQIQVLAVLKNRLLTEYKSASQLEKDSCNDEFVYNLSQNADDHKRSIDTFKKILAIKPLNDTITLED